MKFLIIFSACFVISIAGECFKNDEKSVLNKTVEEYQAEFSLNKLEFTLDMFHQFYEKEEKRNLFFSPASIHQALLMAFFGSQGQTEKQLRSALKIGDESKSELVKAYKMETFYQETRSKNASYELRLANRLYFDTREPIRGCISEIFSSEIEILDFENKTEESRVKINSWVEEETKGKILDIVPSGFLSEETRVAIVNSAYFKGSWEQQFKKSHTKMGLFYVNETEITPTMMMYQKGSFRHGISETLKSYILELPYANSPLSFYILLPPFTPNALEETISKLNASTLEEAMENMIHDSIEILLPKFKLQQTLELTKALKSLNVIDLFDETKANLMDFSEKPGLAVGAARHKAFLEVNEEGAEAAAATALIGTRSGRPLEQTRFNCNHPFVFFVYDNVLKDVLFIGAFHGPGRK